jgi:DNA-binding transcriptional ArsR family regulator
MLQSLRQFKAEIFQAMGHPTRIAILEYLRDGEISVGNLCEKVGIEQANASQHLAVLRSKHIVDTRKDGNQIFYRLRDPILGEMLEMMRQYFFDHMNEAMEMLKQEQQEAIKATPKKIAKQRTTRHSSRSH